MKATLFVLFLLRTITAHSKLYILPPCDNEAPAAGKGCTQIVATSDICEEICRRKSVDCFADVYVMEGGKLNCTLENISHNFEFPESHFDKLSEHIKNKSSVDIAPFLSTYSIVACPLAAKITEVNEKDQAVGLMLMMMVIWTDPRFRWSPEDFGGITKIPVKRDSIWRPPIFPMNMLSFASDNTVKSNVEIYDNGRVSDVTVWNFRKAVNFQFQDFPFDRHSFEIILSTTNAGIKLIGTYSIMSRTQAPSEWRVVEDFNKVLSSANILKYKVVIKRYPYFWLKMVIYPCFILGFLVIAALTLGADSSSVEALVNIGLAASVASAVVVSTMTDNFPKTEKLPNIATFVQDQFLIIVSVLVTLFIRKAVMAKIDKALEDWQQTERNEELSTAMKFVIKTVQMLKHHLFLFFVFGVAYTTCFYMMIRNADYNFEIKNKTVQYDLENMNIFEGDAINFS